MGRGDLKRLDPKARTALQNEEKSGTRFGDDVLNLPAQSDVEDRRLERTAPIKAALRDIRRLESKK